MAPPLCLARVHVFVRNISLLSAIVLLACEESAVEPAVDQVIDAAPPPTAMTCTRAGDGSETCRLGNVTVKRHGGSVEMVACQASESRDDFWRICLTNRRSSEGDVESIADLTAEAEAFGAKYSEMFNTRRSAPPRVSIAPDTSTLPPDSSVAAVSPDGIKNDPQGVRDSAGVQIVENSSPQFLASRAWRLSATPTLDIGTSGGAKEYEFQNIMGVVRLADQSLVVADMGSSQLRWYDMRGRFIRAVGRAGAGPGEFRQLLGVRRLTGDSLMSLSGPTDHDIFGPAGGYAGRIVPQIPNTSRSTSLLSISGWFDDGTAVIIPWTSNSGTAPRGAILTDSISSYLWRRPSTYIGSIGPLPRQTRGTSGDQVMHVTFGPTGMAAVQGQYLYWGFPNEYAVKSYDSRGKLVRIIRRSWTPHIVSTTELEAWKQSYTNPNGAEPGGLPLDGLYQLRTRNLSNMIIAKSLPAFTQIMSDRSGNIWLRESRVTHFYVEGSFSAVTRESSEYSVFDPSGRWICNVTVPKGVKVMEIGADYLTGVRKDSDDVEHVVVYRLEK